MELDPDSTMKLEPDWPLLTPPLLKGSVFSLAHS